jgi:hypothetical protein
MKKTYQPIVKEKANELVDDLVFAKFFEDYELESTNFAVEYFSEKLTEKFIDGVDFDDEDSMIELFSEEEFEVCLKEIVAGTILYELKENGLVESYEDNQTEEVFFLTEEGKKLLRKKGENLPD